MSQLNRSASQQANSSAQGTTNTIYRIPPPPPSTPPISSPDSIHHVVPQPPLRTNIKTTLHKNIAPQQQHLLLNEETINRQQSVRAPSQSNANNNNNQHESATNAAARLVYKSVMMGSVQSLNNQNNPVNNPMNANNQNQVLNDNIQAINHHTKNLSIGTKELMNSSKVQPQPYQSSPLNDYNAMSSPNKINRDLSDQNTNNAIGTNMNSNLSKPKHNLPWILINGEFLLHKDENEPIYSEIIFVMPDNRGVRGHLYVTNFRLYFRSDGHHSNQYQSNLIIDLPLGLINRIEKIGHQSAKQTNFYGLLINCKNGRRLRFATTQEKSSRKQIYELLQKYAFPISNNLNYFGFNYKQIFPDNSGWLLYDVKQEYERMGISKSNDWRYTNINQSYKFCDTYPKLLVVPQSVTDDDLRQVGEFRSKRRIPVVSWLKYDNRKNHAALLRSSQPLVGITQKRSEKDENYLYTIYKLNTINSLDKLYIMDARPLVNAVANRTTGGGYENEDNYKDCEICFLNIQNIHVMRESLRKVFDMAMPSTQTSNTHQNVVQNTSNLVSNYTGTLGVTGASGNSQTHHRSISYGGGGNLGSSSQTNSSNSALANSNALNDDKNYFINLENSKWLEHIKSLLNGALKIVKYINDHSSSVLVHCSDGWDRTSQLTSLAMLMMDKYYRTIKGFEILIEKEWLSFGHRFGIRMGHGSDKHSDQDRSPIFLQFIDAVWQIMQQNSKVFEFNEKFLLTILNNMYTCQFGTFLYNNEFEREKYDVRNKTISLWSYINSYKNEFRNNAYIEHDGVVECSTSITSLQLWTAYYFQYKEIIDDSLNESTLNSMSYFGQSSKPNHVISYTITPPMPSKVFGQALFQQVVNQMKASVRSYSSQEPELIKYRACIQQTDISN